MKMNVQQSARHLAGASDKPFAWRHRRDRGRRVLVPPQPLGSEAQCTARCVHSAAQRREAARAIFLALLLGVAGGVCAEINMVRNMVRKGNSQQQVGAECVAGVQEPCKRSSKQCPSPHVSGSMTQAWITENSNSAGHLKVRESLQVHREPRL